MVTGKDGWQNTSVLLTCKRKGLQVSNPVGCSELTLSAGMAARCLLIDAPTCRMAGNCLMNRLLYVLHDSSFPGNEGPHSFGLNLDDRDLVVSVTWCMGGWKGEEAALRIFVRCQLPPIFSECFSFATSLSVISFLALTCTALPTIRRAKRPVPTSSHLILGLSTCLYSSSIFEKSFSVRAV